MISVQGIYDGKSVKILEKITDKKKFKVVVTFIEEIKPDDSELRSFSAQTTSMGFWENKEENIYQDYLRNKKK